MASAIKSALPSHLSPLAGAGNGGKDSGNEQEFTSRHHGKTRSHMPFPSSASYRLIREIACVYICALSRGQPRGQPQKAHQGPVDSSAFENTSTNVAAAQMRNALTQLAESVEDPEQKKLFDTEMDNFFALFRRYLNDKAKGNAVDWDRIAPPAQGQVVDYEDLANTEAVQFLDKLAVLKLNGGLGTSMGCVGPKSVIEVRDGMSFLDLSVRQIEYLNRTYNVNVPFILMNSFNTNDDTAAIIKKYEGHNVDILTFNQSRYPRILKDSLLPVPKKFESSISEWYLRATVMASSPSTTLASSTAHERGIEMSLSNVDNWRVVTSNDELEMGDHPQRKDHSLVIRRASRDISIIQLETAVGAAIRHFNNAHGVNVPRRRFLPVKTCSDLMLVKSDLYTVKHGQLQMSSSRFGDAPLIKLGSDFKKVSDFQKHIPSIPKIIELDHLTITGGVNLGRGVTLKGTVIIVATEGSTIDIPPGSILENVVVQGSLRLLEH
ncbi:UTP-glucose-1-phosphate uridylyltransferase [Verticillium alfalfae VaMs.102]|uniref:UTP--glucose-1-phosphate uridylyltransferase n=1 Tax=Verticillium alfalfae (strain VaMs.102 / ATCC MYA-4576 / FGSC 10136) TaxID=526221 RepID=C9SLT9_VERA1|nr:UTP-glucose-1-phosphate uridylyltransferase [Verticillium alfalfae VaMs.102]EEY19754.1 UTP-glucose-1-phosphate uridylyltransferase [Verticillium alfalfae VaMs.102]